MIVQNFQASNLYGKEPEQVKDMIRHFCSVLGDHDFAKIKCAMDYHNSHIGGLPDAAEINQIILRGGNKPPFERTVYLALVKKKQNDPYAYNVLTRAQEEYISDYEKFITTGKY